MDTEVMSTTELHVSTQLKKTNLVGWTGGVGLVKCLSGIGFDWSRFWRSEWALSILRGFRWARRILLDLLRRCQHFLL